MHSSLSKLACVVPLLLSVQAFAARAEPKRINLEVQGMQIHNVLRMLAEVGHQNIMIPDEVQGTVTLKLRNVSWTDALDAVLLSKSLGMEQRGNIIRVAPLRQLQEEGELRARTAKLRQDTAPLITRIIPVSYARASEMLPHVQATLSPRGSASVDARTNSIIVRDIAQ